MSTSRKTKILLAVALLMTIGMSGAYALLYTAIKEKTSVAEEITERANDLESKQGKLSLSLTILKDRAADIEALDAAFIKESAAAGFAQQLEALGPRSGTTLKIESLDPGVAKKGGSPVLNFRMEASGKFDQIMYLLKLLEIFPAKVGWGEVQLTRVDDPAALLGEKNKSPTAPVWKIKVAANILNFIHE